MSESPIMDEQEGIGMTELNKSAVMELAEPVTEHTAGVEKSEHVRESSDENTAVNEGESHEDDTMKADAGGTPAEDTMAEVEQTGVEGNDEQEKEDGTIIAGVKALSGGVKNVLKSGVFGCKSLIMLRSQSRLSSSRI
jgi:hypothetical protein